MTLTAVNLVLVVGLAVLGSGSLFYYVGKQDGRREEQRCNGASVAAMLRESHERDEKVRALLAEVETLRARRTGRA